MPKSRRRLERSSRRRLKRLGFGRLHRDRVYRNEKGRSEERPLIVSSSCGLGRVVHLVLDRMRGVLEADHLLHLQLDVAVDEIVVEHAADLEELAILVEA